MKGIIFIDVVCGYSGRPEKNKENWFIQHSLQLQSNWRSPAPDTAVFTLPIHNFHLHISANCAHVRRTAYETIFFKSISIANRNCNHIISNFQKIIIITIWGYYRRMRELPYRRTQFIISKSVRSANVYLLTSNFIRT